MNKHEKESFRQQLAQLERHTRNDAAALAAEAFHTADGMAVGNLSDTPIKDRADRASDNYCEETTLGLVEHADDRLREINAALDRLDDGVYGRCQGCAREIPIDRLRAVPYARECVKCAGKAERGESPSPGNL